MNHSGVISRVTAADETAMGTGLNKALVHQILTHALDFPSGVPTVPPSMTPVPGAMKRMASIRTERWANVDMRISAEGGRLYRG